jgi:hypothetical protein
VDAICINQEDKEERSIQIGRMAAIYKQAKEVVIWLGEIEDLSEVNLAILSQADPDNTPTEVLDTSSVTVFQLLSRDYWSRVWIVQELAAASHITLLCGPFAIPWQTIRRFLDHDREANVSSIQMPEDLSEVKTRFEKISSFREDKLARKPITLIEALYRTRHALSTDPKDKLYALLGLAYDSTNFIPHPNYNLTKEEVYKRFTIALLENGYRFDFLGLRSAQREVHGALPSWVVDWSDLNDDLAKRFFDAVMREGLLPEVTARSDWVVDGDVLKIEGHIVGRVETVKTSSQNNVDTGHNSHIKKIASFPTVSCLNIRLDPTLTTGTIAVYDLSSRLKADNTFTEVLQSMADADDQSSRAQHTSQKMARKLEIQKWMKRRKVQMVMVGDSGEFEHEPEKWSHHEAIDDLIERMQLGMQIAVHAETADPGRCTAAHLGVTANSSADTDQAVVPVLGYLPSKTEAGDVIVISRSYWTVFVLRADADRYRLVGLGSFTYSIKHLPNLQQFEII